MINFDSIPQVQLVCNWICGARHGRYVIPVIKFPNSSLASDVHNYYAARDGVSEVADLANPKGALVLGRVCLIFVVPQIVFLCGQVISLTLPWSLDGSSVGGNCMRNARYTG